jgi:hypothetical protein
MLIVPDGDNFVESFYSLVPVTPQIAPLPTHPNNMPAPNVVEVIRYPFDTAYLSH